MPDPVAQPLHEVELVAGEHHRHALVGLLPQHAAHHVDRDRVEAGERLVEHQDLRVVDECGGELHPLLVAEAQLLHVVVAPLGDAEPLGPGVRRPPRRRRRHAVQAGQVDELVGDLHPRVEAALLGHVADVAAGVEIDRSTVPADRARVGRQHAERDAHRGRLAGAVAPTKPKI